MEANAFIKPPEKIPSFLLLGCLFMMFGSGFSRPNARAGILSVTRLMKRRCGAFKIVKLIMVAKKIEITSERLDPSKNWIALRMLSYILLPSPCFLE